MSNEDFYIDWSRAPDGTTQVFVGELNEGHFGKGVPSDERWWEKVTSSGLVHEYNEGIWNYFGDASGWSQCVRSLRIKRPIEEATEMTPFERYCQDVGVAIDSKFLVAGARTEFSKGDIIVTSQDYGDNVPLFTRITDGIEKTVSIARLLNGEIVPLPQTLDSKVKLEFTIAELGVIGFALRGFSSRRTENSSVEEEIISVKEKITGADNRIYGVLDASVAEMAQGTYREELELLFNHKDPVKEAKDKEKQELLNQIEVLKTKVEDLS